MKFQTHEEGSTTILMLSVATFVIVMFTAITFGFSIAFEYRKTQSSADLAALAGANIWVVNPLQACDLASQIVQRNQAQLETCEASDGVVEIRVKSNKFGWVQATAKAGIF